MSFKRRCLGKVCACFHRLWCAFLAHDQMQKPKTGRNLRGSLQKGLPESQNAARDACGLSVTGMRERTKGLPNRIVHEVMSAVSASPSEKDTLGTCFV